MTRDPWSELLTAIAKLSWHKTGESPFHCEHDVLYVMSDPSKYSEEELAIFDYLGFFPSEENDCFMSYRFGSA